MPANVTINGVQIDLNWIGQNAGTGVLSGVQLYYLGSPLGNVKAPGIQNQAFNTDTLQGSSGDDWGAALTPAIINDTTFGFGVQDHHATIRQCSDRSFVNSMGITVFYSTQDANITPVASTDPQVAKINFYRQGQGLSIPTFVGQGPNSATAFSDTLSDLAAASNPQLQFDNFEPFPSIDLPQTGTLSNAASNVLTWVSGGSVPAGASTQFNIRWLPGTVIIIGSPDGVAYSSVRRPSSATTWDFTNNDPTVPTIPDGTNLPYYIGAPPLAQQPLPYMFGITDNINFVFAVGDPLRPGTLYWCKGNNLDSAPDTNQLEVTDPGEPLVNGAMSNGLGVLFSIKRAWIIEPNFYNALATATGTTGSPWSALQATAINRGLFIPRCIAVEGGGRIFFRVDDGISISIAGGADQSITDQTLYPLFAHEGSTPQAVTRNGITISPPDDSQPQQQQFSNVQNTASSTTPIWPSMPRATSACVRHPVAWRGCGMSTPPCRSRMRRMKARACRASSSAAQTTRCGCWRQADPKRSRPRLSPLLLVGRDSSSSGSWLSSTSRTRSRHSNTVVHRHGHVEQFVCAAADYASSDGRNCDKDALSGLAQQVRMWGPTSLRQHRSHASGIS